MSKKTKNAKNLHKNVPSNWYYKSIYVDKNILQWFVHNKRFKEVKKLVEPSGGKLLDIGSADGVFTKVILDKSKANMMIGVDVLKHSVDWARKHWKKEKKLQFEVADAHELTFKKSSFDAVFAIEVLEHVYEPAVVLKEIERVLKKNGYAVFLVPAETLLFRIAWFFWTKSKGKIWKGTHVHAYSGDFLIQLAKATGFKIEEEKKIIFGTLHLIKVRKSQ